METEKNHYISQRKRTHSRNNNLKYSFRFDHELKEKLSEFSKKKKLDISGSIRLILNEFFNEREKNTSQKVNKLQRLNDITNESLRTEILKIKKALFAIGKSSPINSRKIREIFKDENLD